MCFWEGLYHFGRVGNGFLLPQRILDAVLGSGGNTAFFWMLYFLFLFALVAVRVASCIFWYFLSLRPYLVPACDPFVVGELARGIGHLHCFVHVWALDMVVHDAGFPASTVHTRGGLVAQTYVGADTLDAFS